MLHIALRDKIQQPEFRLLYDSKMPISTPEMRQLLTNTIQKLRQQYNTRTKRDPIDHKEQTYGNEGGWYVAKVKELVKKLYQPKNISNEFAGQWRSIEFEVIFKSKKDVEDFAILAHQKGLGKYVHIHEDGSLRVDNENEKAQEVSLSYRSGNEQVVRDFCSLLKGRAKVNKTCGTHVHFDFRHVGVEEANLYGKRLARCVPALKLLLPVARRESEYCKTNINNPTGANPGGGHARYAFVNMMAYGKYKTIEVRGHSGTINADKILNWIKLCEVIMATDFNFAGHPEHRNEVVKITDLTVQYADKLDQRMIDYINERFTRFSVSSSDEAENTIEAQEVANPPMFNPQPKKKAPAKKRSKKKENAFVVPDGAIPAPVNAQHEVAGG